MKIGIEKSLTNVKEYLEKNNENVSFLNESQKGLKKYDAIVASGLDSNFLGMHDTSSKAPVINADGKTPEQIYSELQNRMK